MDLDSSKSTGERGHTMRPEPDAPEESSLSKPGSPRINSDLPAFDRTRSTKPITGGYYWLPAPDSQSIVWTVVSCWDLHCGPDDGHDAELWPRLMVPLAKAWGKDAQILKRRLALSYTGLPRGRVTRSGKQFLILHGNDSPVTDWRELVTERFDLPSRTLRFLFDEHETPIPGHPAALESALGCRLFGP